MLVLRVAVLLASILSLRGEMCSTMVTIAPGEEGKPLTAKAFAEFTAKCRKDRNKGNEYRDIRLLLFNSVSIQFRYTFYFHTS